MPTCTTHRANHDVRIRNLARILVGLACFLGPSFQTVDAQEPKTLPSGEAGRGGEIVFPLSVIPRIPSSLPIVKLTAKAPPEEFLRETLGKIGVDLKTIQPLSHTSLLAARNAPDQLVGVVEGDKLHAYWHRESGQAEIFPQLEKLESEVFSPTGDQHLEHAVTLARETFARAGFIPKDDTEYIVGEARPLVGSTARRDSADSAPRVSETRLYLTYVPVIRTVKGYKVYGTGSRVAIAVGAERKIQGLVYRWKAGTFSTDLSEKRNAEQIHAAFSKLLRPMAANSEVQVLTVDLAYYDNGGDSMIPVYRATARLRPLAHAGAAKELLAHDDYVAEYVAYGEGKLPVELVPGSGKQPSEAPRKRAGAGPEKIPAGDPIVGMYVVRDAPPASGGTGASSGFVAEANGLWNGLQSSGGASQFTLAQYYWAVPQLYTTDEAAFVNSVNVALTEAHGAPWLFTTESNCCDTVNINAIPASEGYGGSNGGHLDYWIIHSCAVVPSAEDNPAWWTPWFTVFQGLHAVMGSRTEMYFDGGAVNQPFGQSIGNGASVISSWFNATLSYYPASKQPPMDRPSAVTVCGHEPDSAYDTATLPAPSCLTNYWQPN
jgi:uncharacterized protein DUF6345